MILGTQNVQETILVLNRLSQMNFLEIYLVMILMLILQNKEFSMIQ